MTASSASSVLSDPPSPYAESTDFVMDRSARHRRSVDTLNADDAPPNKRRKTAPSHHQHHHNHAAAFDRAPSSPPQDEQYETDISSDSETSGPASPTHDEYAMRDDAQTQCLWRDCAFGDALNNDELVHHVQTTHCATGGPKKTKYVCEWGECQRKTSNHPSGYALKAHMRSHTKEKPYYCALPECDKSFTRSDALAKHMRTVHEPEPGRGHGIEPAVTGKKATKLKITNGNGTASKSATSTTTELSQPGPTHDEDGNPIDPSPAGDNIAYIPAHHPVTGQPGFMINYPPDIIFSSFESSIPATQLMRLLRRQLHWAEQEGKELKRENEGLERLRREEWTLKEILLEGMLEEELARGKRIGMLYNIDRRTRRLMEKDTETARRLQWTGGSPAWRRNKSLDGPGLEDTLMDDAHSPSQLVKRRASSQDNTPSPPPTGRSGGFDGEGDPSDNYLAWRMAGYEERERLRSLQNTPQKSKVEQQAAEADAVGALMGLSGQ